MLGQYCKVAILEPRQNLGRVNSTNWTTKNIPINLDFEPSRMIVQLEANNSYISYKGIYTLDSKENIDLTENGFFQVLQACFAIAGATRTNIQLKSKILVSGDWSSTIWTVVRIIAIE